MSVSLAKNVNIRYNSLMRSYSLTLIALSLAISFLWVGVPTGLAQQQQKPQCPPGSNTYLCHGVCISNKDLCLLEPLLGDNGPKSIPASETMKLGALKYYVNQVGVWKILFSLSAAIAVLQGIVAGFQIAYGGQSSLDQAKSRFMWAVIGLLMLMLSGVILNFINPIGFSSTL